VTQAAQRSPCCGPSADRPAAPAVADPVTVLSTPTDHKGMVLLGDGEFLMGSDDRLAYPDDGEDPVRRVRLAAFWIDACAVRNDDFARFVDDSGYVTEAERFGWSFVFAGLLPDDFQPTRGVARAPWWRQVEGASWRHPEGPQSDVEGREDHPVLHVSWNDAHAYATAVGKRLPTEAKWEYAARGGLEAQPYPWGDELEPDGGHRMNVWQGVFPRENTEADGYYGTCPVDAFEPSDYGLHNMTGNTWEWCADWFSRDFHTRDRHTNPKGPRGGTHKTTRGGSYLCHASYCRRYRVSARNALTPDSSAGNIGFRCAASS
jgi:formylglycine-generating enzyme required for sulfatase activity